LQKKKAKLSKVNCLKDEFKRCLLKSLKIFFTTFHRRGKCKIYKMILNAKNLILVLLSLQISACTGQVKEKSVTDTIENKVNTQPLILKQSTTFPQIHTNLNGMVREFVRTMYQDKKGNYWFGTNGDGIIRYNGQILEKITIDGISPHFRVLEIVEDKAGNIWFGTSEGLIKYDGKEFTTFSKKEGLPGEDEGNLGLNN
jgi:hypothetical protein